MSRVVPSARDASLFVRCTAPSIALISLLAMSKREPEPLMPVQPQHLHFSEVVSHVIFMYLVRARLVSVVISEQ